MSNIVPIRCAELDLMHPACKHQFKTLFAHLELDYVQGKVNWQFKVFETYRTPQRQAWVYGQGNSKAQPYRSAHQFGFAADFVPWTVERGYTWDVETAAWDWLRSRAVQHSLLNDLSWDRAHVESPLWRNVIRPALLGAETGHSRAG